MDVFRARAAFPIVFVFAGCAGGPGGVDLDPSRDLSATPSQDLSGVPIQDLSGVSDLAQSDLAQSDLTLPSTCSSGMRDGDETDVDCGGTCGPCGPGKGCVRARDCDSGVCDNNKCAGPSCGDGTKNGDETDVDCGGPCPKCGLGKTCALPGDCQSGRCVNATCQPGVDDLGLPGVDLGPGDLASPDLFAGPPDLPSPDLTVGPPDLASPDLGRAVEDLAMARPDLTAMSTCKDGIKNGGETDVDCGGMTCPKCGNGNGCLQPSDCASGRCDANRRCVPAQLTVSFSAPRTVVSGAANGILAGDLNGDGKADLVVGDGNVARFAALLGNGDASFQNPKYASPGPNFASYTTATMALGDVSGDDKPDLVYTWFLTDKGGAAVKLGNGDGTFQAAVEYPLFNKRPNAIALADLNRDGRRDCAVSINDNTRSLALLLNLGSGKLGTPSYMNVPNLLGVEAGDFSGDNVVDLAARATATSVAIFLGKGDGTFPTRGGGTTTLSSVGRVLPFHADGDGKLDVAVYEEGSNNAEILTGNGKGGLSSQGKLAVGMSPRWLITADFNLDGNADLVTCNNASGDLSLLLGRGDGTFQAAMSLPVGALPESAVAVDVNGDQKPDIAYERGNVADVLLLINTSQ